MAPASIPSAPPISAAEATALLKKAAYFSLYSMPNPDSPNQPVLSLNPPGIVQVQVHEQLHRFPIDLSAGTQVGEAIGTVSMKWTPKPETFIPIPNVTPPPTALAIASGQPFITMDGRLAFNDGSAMHGFGHGHTFAESADGQVLYIGAVVNMLGGEGHLSGGQGTVLVNGHIQPPTELSLSVLARYLDPDGRFQASQLSPVHLSPNPDPTYGTLMLLSEVDPAGKAQVDRDEAGNVTGWKVNELLRLVSTNWDASGPNGLRSEMHDGPIVGRFTAQMRISFKSQSDVYTAYIASTTDGVVTFEDLKGNKIGTIKVDLEVANAFDIDMPTAPVPMFRLGGFGPIKKSTGFFGGAMGVMSVNGAFTLEPLAVSTLHIFRLFDPDGVIRTLMKDAWKQETRTYPSTALSAQEQALVAAVDDSLPLGLALKAWWEQKDANNSIGERFELVRTYNPADRAYGFFDTAVLKQGSFNVMGLLQELPFDCPKTVAGHGLKRQIREYVMRYFLRSTSYTTPVPFSGRSFGEPPGLIAGLLFRNSPNEALRGFGYTQQYYKTVDGSIGAFPLEDQHAVVDLRELGKTFEWIILQVQLFNFVVPFKPLGDNLPQIGIPLQEQTYVVISKDFVVNRPGEYGLGYAILKGTGSNPGDILAYGPGRFQLGFQTIHFTTDKSGATKVRMAFAANRPDKVMNIPYDPVGLAFRALNTVTLGAAEQYSKYVSNYLPGFLTSTGIDPMQLYIAAANAATGGAAAEHFGVSKEELDRLMLMQHFSQHYQMILGAMSTFHRVPDWLATSAIPAWIRSGVLKLN